MVQSPPLRRKKSISIRAAAPVLLDELCAELAERQSKVITDRPKTYRRYQEGLARFACALEALGGKATMGDEAERLLADVQRLEDRIERWLASNGLNDAIADFLDAWAEQQARRKAPQLFGAQPVLAYRQARRTQWSRLRSSLVIDWRPLRPNRLRRRANTLLNQLSRKQIPPIYAGLIRASRWRLGGRRRVSAAPVALGFACGAARGRPASRLRWETVSLPRSS